MDLRVLRRNEYSFSADPTSRADLASTDRVRDDMGPERSVPLRVDVRLSSGTAGCIVGVEPDTGGDAIPFSMSL